ncbi:MAG: alpha/beta fold hydrolase [Bacteroidota bacterium]
MSTWILLRGLSRESRHWGDFPAALRAACPDAEIHALDLPGNGRLNRQTSPARVAEMAKSCREHLRECGLPPPYFVVALSLGAMVAVDWAARHPSEIAGCVLINTSLRPFSPFYQRLKPGNYPALLGLLLRGDPEARERTILRLTSCQAERPATLASWVGHARQNPVSPGNALRQLVAAARYRAPLQKPVVPLLIIASAQDKLVDPRSSRRLAAAWNTAFAEHPTAGHDLPLDDAPWVGVEIRRWLGTRLSASDKLPNPCTNYPEQPGDQTLNDPTDNLSRSAN